MVAELNTGMAGADSRRCQTGPGKAECPCRGLRGWHAARMAVCTARTGMIDMGDSDRMIEGMGERERLHAQQCEHHECTT